MAKIINQGEITFKNYKNEVDGLIPLSAGILVSGAEGPDPQYGGIVNAVDIDWNGAVVGQDKNENDIEINSTSDLINYIKGAYSQSKAEVSPATNSQIGGIKIGYTSSENNIAVVLDENNKAYVTIPLATEERYGLMSSNDFKKLTNVNVSSETDGNIYYETFEINGIYFVTAYQSENYATRGKFLVTDINTIRTKFLTNDILKNLKKLVFIQYNTSKSLVSISTDIKTRVLEFSIARLSYVEGSSNTYTYSGYISGNFDVINNNTSIDINIDKISYKQFNYIPTTKEWQTSDIIGTASSSSAGLLSYSMYNKIYNSRITRGYNVVNTSSSDNALRKALYTLLTSSNTYGEEVVLKIIDAHTSGNYSGTMALYIKTLYYNNYASSVTTLPQIIFKIKGFISYENNSLKLVDTRTKATTLDNYKELLIKASSDDENEIIIITEVIDLLEQKKLASTDLSDTNNLVRWDNMSVDNNTLTIQQS